MSARSTSGARIDARYYEQAALWGAEHVENPAHQLMRFEAIADLLPPEARRVVDLGSADWRCSAVSERSIPTHRTRSGRT
jgi:hypothetical protein